MLKLLLVEDDLDLAHTLIQYLELEGMLCDHASNGVAGLNLSRNHHYDVLLLDINLPRMDGLTLIRSLRELTSYARVPILMLTTEFSDEMKAKGKAAGANGWLVKPFDPQRLTEVVRKVIG